MQAFVAASFGVRRAKMCTAPKVDGKKPSTNVMPSRRPATLKAVLFDLDGTCVNSDHIHYETYRDTLLEMVPKFNNGTPITRKFYDKNMSGRQNPDILVTILPDLSYEQQEKIWTAKEERYEEVITRGVKPIPGLLDLLNYLSDNDVQTFVVTNAPVVTCRKTMESIGIKEHFQNRVVCAEECSHPKPHPAPYLRGLELTGINAEEAIAFEDSPSGTKSATSAGLITVGIRSTQSEETLLEAGAEITIGDFKEERLWNAIKKWI